MNPEQNFIIANKEKRFLCLQPRTTSPGDRDCCTGEFGADAAPQILPQAQCPLEIDLINELNQTADQDGTNLCHSFAGTAGNEIARFLAGHDPLKLSAVWLANKVTGGRNDGAGIDRVMEALLTHGQPPAAGIDNLNYRGPYTAAQNAAAAAFRPLEIWDIGNADVLNKLRSALAQGMPVVLGTYAFGGGHAVVATGYRTGPRKVLRYTGWNSWGRDWSNCGRPGYWEFAEHQLSGLDMFGAFAIQAVSDRTFTEN